MNAPLYTIEILRLAASLEGPRALERTDGAAELRSPTCGSRIATSVQLSRDGRIEAMSQEVQACAFGQASAALLQQHATGRSRHDLSDALGALESWLGGGDEPQCLPVSVLAPMRSKRARHGAVLLPLRTLLAAVDSHE